MADTGAIGGVTGSLVDLEPGDLFVALPFVDGDAHRHVKEALSRGAALALVAESWAGLEELPSELARRCVRVEDVVRSFRAIARRLREQIACPVVAVIGSNGKTTTKEMLAAMLSGPGRKVVRTPGTDNGYLGLPRTICDRAIRAGESPDALVLEIGIDARGAMVDHARLVRPDVAVVTALGAEHLDGLGDVATAIEEELSLFEEVPSARRVVSWWDGEIQKRRGVVRDGDVAVVEETGEAEEGSAPLGKAGVPDKASALVFRVERRGAGSVVSAEWHPEAGRGEAVWRGRFEVPMPGAHNARNFALALGAALSLGRTGEEIAAGWADFEAPAWRSSLRPLARGAFLYDDCFNASPPSVRAAIEALSQEAWAGRPKVVVLGEMMGLGAESERWHVELAGALAGLRGAVFHFIGPGMAALAAAAGGRSPDAARALGQGRVIEDASRDPVELVADMDLPRGAIVLVKGSRGMRMERVVAYLERRWRVGVGESAEATSVLVAGSSGVRETAQRVSEVLHPEWGGVRVIEVRHGDIPRRAVEPGAKVIVWTGFSEADVPEGTDVELYLAEEAQLFVQAKGLRAVILNGGDPVSGLLAEVIPRGVRVLRFEEGSVAVRAASAAHLVTLVLDGTGEIQIPELC